MREGSDQLPATGVSPVSSLARPRAAVSDAPRVDLRHMPCAFANPIGWKARIGLIVLATDHTIEFEWRQLIDAAALSQGARDSVALYAARILNEPTITAETLTAMETRIADTADLLLPGMPFDVVAYGCTAASMLIGPERVRARVQQARPDAAVTDPLTAATRAFEALGVRRLAVLTPYAPSINAEMRTTLQEYGWEIPVMGSFCIDDDNLAARASARSLHDAVLELGRSPEVDGVFVSCTSIRLAEVVEPLEQALGKPVISSNLALGWDALRLAGVVAPLDGFGRLFRHPRDAGPAKRETAFRINDLFTL